MQIISSMTTPYARHALSHARVIAGNGMADSPRSAAKVTASYGANKRVTLDATIRSARISHRALS